MSEKSEDKKDIELEEREKILNFENKDTTAPPILEIENGIKINKTDIKEGREVQPKKIPIGGIQMPGFFTRSKSKERCKDGENELNGEAEGTELLQSKHEDDSKPAQTLIKMPNPFRKSKLINEEEDKSTESKEKKSLLKSIRLPIATVFPRIKKGDQSLSDQTNKAGLASMETLDETDKSADKKDEDLKNVCLDISVDEKGELEKQQSEEEPSWKHKVKAYRIVINLEDMRVKRFEKETIFVIHLLKKKNLK